VSDNGAQVRGFLLDRSRYVRLDVPGAVTSQAFDINDRGQVVGYYGVAGGKVQGFLRDRSGDITTVDVPGAAGTQPFDMYNRGQVVGLFLDAAPGADGTVPPNTIHGFVWSKGSFRTIDVPGATGSGALDINDRGEIVGGYQDAQGRTHGFRLRKGVFTTIDPPGAVDVPGSPGFAATAPFGISNRGQVVGQYADAQGLHAYLLDDGVYRTIDPPAGPGTTAADINDRGQIVIPNPGGVLIQCESSCGG
jgi:probable HAF family extracellular repeat protein